MKKSKNVARKRFGQNFLIDTSIIQKIIESSKPEAGDHIIEIGPGRAALTEPILQSGAELTAVEIDRDLNLQLKEQFASYENFSLIEGDILKLEWPEIVSQKLKNKIIANIPYNISTPLFFKLIKGRQYFSSITLMVQREIAERILHNGKEGSLKDYGILSVVSANCFKSISICDVSPSCFRPSPKVNSTIIQLRPLETLVEREDDFFNFVKIAFNHRRKKLLPQLRQIFPDFVEQLDKVTKIYLDKIRPENLTPLQYLTLFQEKSLEPL